MRSAPAPRLAPDARAVPDAHLAALDRMLEDDETIRWSGQPRPRLLSMSSAAPVLFGLPWTAFALFWMFAASGFRFPPDFSGPQGWFALFGVPFVLVGFGLLSAPFWARRVAARTVYVVTDRRAVVGAPGAGGFTLRSFLPEDLGDLTLTVRTDGTGSVAFPGASHEITHGSTATGRAPGFHDVADVERVYGLLRDLAALAPPRPPRAPEPTARELIAGARDAYAAFHAERDEAKRDAPRDRPRL